MIVKVKEKRNGEPRELDAIFFRDNKPWFVRTVDPETGHDSADHDFEDLAWDISLNDEDIKKLKICDQEGEVVLDCSQLTNDNNGEGRK